MTFMNKEADIFDEISGITSDLLSVFEKMKHIKGMADDKVEQSRMIALRIPEAISQGIIKIAVVGAIKSGKSTFVNSFVKNDILLRGAASLTSVVTRIRHGDKLEAIVFLKSWDEINQEIEKALMMYPGMNDNAQNINPRGFDLRRKTDRDSLKSVKKSLNSSFFVTDQGIRPESSLVSHALDGYELIKHYVMADPASIVFDVDEFQEHKLFTGHDATSFFVRDVLLHVPETNLASNIEMADCQGSDSLEPCHMSKIQDYLVSANMLIYLISSRTGLREADIRFLKIIQKMGILSNVLFVLNADLSEHDSLDDLLRVEKKVRRDLGYFLENPEIYTFSSLYNLFAANQNILSSKDAARFHQWQQDREIEKYSLKMTRNFNADLTEKIEKETFFLMVSNHMARLKSIARAIEKKVSVFNDLLSEDAIMAASAVDALGKMKEENKGFESMLTSAIENAVDTLRRDIAVKTSSFFDKTHGSCFMKIRQFIQNYPVYDLKFEKIANETGMNNALYSMFQRFRFDLDIFMTSEINPEITAFIQEEEHGIESYFKSLYQGYALDPLGLCPERFEIKQSLRESETGENTGFFVSDPVDIPSARRILGLKYPAASFATAYSARIRMDAIANFGFYSLVEIFARILNKGFRSAGITSLKKAEKRIKKEALISVTRHLSNYKNKIREDYLFPLIKAVARDFHDKTLERFHLSQVESSEIESLMAQAREEKKSQITRLREIKSVVDDVLERIDSLFIQYHSTIFLLQGGQK